MLRLDYISCGLTILSTILVGRRLWYGWIVAGLNSAILCYIGFNTRQTGFIPANLFCIALYAYNLWHWRSPAAARPPKACRLLRWRPGHTQKPAFAAETKHPMRRRSIRILS